jgi:urate oxidase
MFSIARRGSALQRTLVALSPSPRTGRASRLFSHHHPAGSPHTYNTPRRTAVQQNSNNVGGWIVALVAGVAGVSSAIAMAYSEEPAAPPRRADDVQPHDSQRTESFPLIAHNHGKTKVRVLKVHKTDTDNGSGRQHHTVHEYSVSTTLHCAHTEGCFITGDNDMIVATDTQKNSVYVVAKQNEFHSPEEFGVLLSRVLLSQYPWLEAVDVVVDESTWQRAVVDGQPHPHGFVKSGPEAQHAAVHMARTGETLGPPVIQSSLTCMTVLKTTQSGFEGYYLDDPYTILPPTRERCLATELDAVWTCHGQDPTAVDYNAVRQRVRELFQKGIFGPATTGGVYSASLQATVYDAACLILTELPDVQTISVRTPNLHYLPTTVLLGKLGETFQNDVYTPTNEPSGVISCTVSRGGARSPLDHAAAQALVQEAKQVAAALDDGVHA